MKRILAGLMVLALGACGSGDDEAVLVDVSPEGVARAAAQTLDDSSGRFTADLSIEVLGQPLSFTFDGAFADGRSEIQMDLRDLFGQVPGAADEIPEGFDQSIRMITDGSTMYMCGAFLAALTSGNECGSFDLGAAGGVNAGTNDPTAFLRGLAGTDAVEEVGTEEVDGVETTHLRGSYTPRQAMDELDPEQAEALRAQFEQLGSDVDAVLDAEVPFDVWIDGDGLVRRMASSVDLSAAGLPEGGSVDLDMRLFDFGDDIDIDVPTDAVDLGPLLGGFGQED